MDQFYFTYESPYGAGAVVWGQAGVKYHFLPDDEGRVFQRLADFGSIDFKEWPPLKRSLEQYFAGKTVSAWPAVFDLRGFSDFSRRVYAALMLVTYGLRVSYGELASAAGSPGGQRSAGSVLGRNRLPLFLPCHRVIAANGTIGGWSGSPGWKERLLGIEGRVKSEELRSE